MRGAGFALGASTPGVVKLVLLALLGRRIGPQPFQALCIPPRWHGIPVPIASLVRALRIGGDIVPFARAIVDEAKQTCFVRIEGRTHEVELIDPREETAGHDATRDEIHAPMPGAVISVHKAAGDPVARGETIVTIESMKLQTALAAPRDGHILELLKAPGETFDKDELLARLAPADEG